MKKFSRKAPTSFQKEIAWVLILKTMLLFLLWYLFFSHPTEKQTTVQAIQAHIMGNHSL